MNKRGKVITQVLVILILQLVALVVYWDRVLVQPPKAPIQQLDQNSDRVTSLKLGNSNEQQSEKAKDEQEQSIKSIISLKLEEIFKNKEFNSNWLIFTGLHFGDSNIDPIFYEKQRKDFHLYDPHVTMAVYLKELSRLAEINDSMSNISIPFSWQDWVDLSVLNKFLIWEEYERPSCEDIIDHGISYNPLESVKTPNHDLHKDFCIDDVDYQGHVDKHLLPGFSITGDAGPRFTISQKIIQSRSYLLSTMSQPKKLVFLTNKNVAFEIDVDHNKHETMMQNNLFANFINDEGTQSKSKNVLFDPCIEIENLSKILTPLQPQYNFRELLNSSNSFTFDIPKERFRYHPKELLQKLKDTYDSLTKSQQFFVGNLERQVNADMNTVPQHFFEANLDQHVFNDHEVHNEGHHYDLRFFNGYIAESKKNAYDKVSEKHKIILHHMLHTWLSFSFNAGIVSYPAHGSLLSWYWNSMIFPWDNDIDVILPIQDLSDLCMNFNNSLIIQSPTDGFGKYYLDCSSSLTVRQHGNGANNIDARFIDVDSGMYIDLTGLAVTGDPFENNKLQNYTSVNITSEGYYELHDSIDLYNCRNFHFYSHNEVSPLKLTMMEHGSAFTPSNVKDSLLLEYDQAAIVNEMYGDNLFIDKLQLWVSKETFLKAAKKVQSDINISDDVIRDFYRTSNPSVLNSLLDEDEVFFELVQSWFQTRAHKLEIDLHRKLASVDKKDSKKEYRAIKKQFDDLMAEYLTYHSTMRKNILDYNTEVEMLNLNLHLEFQRQEISILS